VPAALIKMSVAERERLVRWWLEESGLTRAQLREVAGAMWTDRERELDEQDWRLDPPPGARRRSG